jgi:hypothetical protein
LRGIRKLPHPDSFEGNLMLKNEDDNWLDGMVAIPFSFFNFKNDFLHWNFISID